MEKQLKLYFEDIDNIFEEAKLKVGYNHFAESCKKVFNPAIAECIDKARISITPYVYDTEFAVELLAKIQEMIQKVFIGFKISDELYKSNIYSMSPGTEVDSTFVYDFSPKEWKMTIKL